MAVVRRFNGRCFCFRIMCFCVDGEEGGAASDSAHVVEESQAAETEAGE